MCNHEAGLSAVTLGARAMARDAAVAPRAVIRAMGIRFAGIAPTVDTQRAGGPMKIASTVITSAAALLLVAAPAFAQGAGGAGAGGAGGGVGASGGAGGTGTGSAGTAGSGRIGTPGTLNPSTGTLGTPGTVSPGTPGTPGSGAAGTLGGGGSATNPCVGVNCPGGGMASPSTPGGTTSSTPGTSVPDASRRGNPVNPSSGTPMSQQDCLGGGWSRAGLPSASACLSAPGISR
jgi:hypothetical protein